MPIYYHIDRAWDIVVTTVEGEVTAHDLEAHAAALASDPLARERDELADLTNVAAADVSSEAVSRIARWLREADTNRPAGKFAMVAPRDAAFGMARLYRAYRQHPDIQIQVFRDLDDALRWLGIGPGGSTGGGT